MNVSSDFWELIHHEIDKLVDSDPPRESTVREVFEDIASSVSSPQSEGDEVSVSEDLPGQPLNEAEKILALSIEEENAESVGWRGPLSLSIEPLHPMSDCRALMKVNRTIVSSREVLPGYKTMSEFPGNVVYGLKVWMIDGVVHYRKRLRHETNVNDKEREGILVHLSESLREGLRQTRNDEQEWDSFGYWTPLTRAGKERPDWDLWWFLVHRGVDGLWQILMGGTGALKGQFFFHFPTEFDQEQWGKKAQ